ncbi:protease modulator HflC [Verticiella sediminum]|uniref:Protein HflC n=1 Tax=Verticiella sediminum TaxID=1247510 RepID=A0A556ADW4_9BURK|nr:protease modulator HflC [Verticiella sediminum]TSH91055.1 protease modulator HflC [Verticiella sediminum]
MNRILMPLGILVAILVVIALSCTFIVRERDYALVFALGEVREVIDEPGLYFKLPPPFQNVVYLEKRLLTIDDSQPERIQTAEKINLLIDAYAKWRIADPRLYYVTFGGDERGAQARLQAVIRDALNASVNRRTVAAVISRERNMIMDEIRNNVAKTAASVGVEVVDVRLKRIDFVPEISESVYRRMEAERTRAANEQRSIGAAESERIRANAERQRDEIVAEAYARAQALMGEGDAEAGGIFAQAYGKDAEFFNFYRSLQAYRESFRSRSDVLVVSPDSDFFRYFGNVSGNGGAPAAPAPLPATP